MNKIGTNRQFPPATEFLKHEIAGLRSSVAAGTMDSLYVESVVKYLENLENIGDILAKEKAEYIRHVRNQANELIYNIVRLHTYVCRLKMKNREQECFIVMAHSKKDVRLTLRDIRREVKLERWHIKRLKAYEQCYQRIV